MMRHLPQPWNYNSEVVQCRTCEGVGEIWDGRGFGGNDPDSGSVTCPECEGDPIPACAVCGFEQMLTGYDCIACDTIASLHDAELNVLDIPALAVALANAANARLASVKVAA